MTHQALSIRPIQGWGNLLGDEPEARAILDRSLNHAHTVAISGRGYSLKDKTQTKEAKPAQNSTEEPAHD
jgi:DNA replication protein DnaC